ncbi:assimilatory sulfite reductase (NADPH) flavoprotein subunit [Jeotgalibacillus proteolyticus]|uniref:assimilatory sulfite reductase (NADPH) n=1 Tax=Jeotgalibacillus proteolyticus TaxID=2082395 RepID=A0A2S5G7T3_9BACL|nr:assimilatory sulfite reductase (NADPH) flavoprotein subunit [Jeotgalibacillus proteolyticus]PPA69057.1 assimilatory sulfite reductase (NADPH) flavoprotein subunit [Jeotgalibacillus proteolyticus]
MQLHVKNSPFNEEQTELINRLIPTLTDHQKAWLTGYLSAAQATQALPSADPAEKSQVQQGAGSQGTSPAVTREVTLLIGSHTGNGESVANDVEETLKKEQIKVSRFSMDEFKPKSLSKVEDLLVITSTHGDGDPPDNALELHEFLHSKRAPKLEGVRFSVLSLGDSSYEFFCQTGKDFDQRLEELGAKRLFDRVDCDLDFEEPAAQWLSGVLGVLNESKAADVSAQETSEAAESSSVNQPAYSRTNPFHAEILENINLNGRGSNKETRHIELDLEGSNLSYQPGDSLGIIPENDPALVDQLIEAAGWDPDESVSINKDGDIRSLHEALIKVFEITSLSKPLIEKAAALTGNEGLKELLKPEQSEKLKTYIYGRDLIDLTEDYGPWEVPAKEFVGILRKIPARLYSIASSPNANPDEVHLTIGALRYDSNGRNRTGVCSVQCAERSEPGSSLPVFVQSNNNFRLPENPDTPVIMIGAGTGVAPYRAFLEEREESGASGKSWLFFGDQHFVTDFLYQTEWLKWLKEGVLTRMDVAFSRDSEEKVYVQHRMLEKGKELFEWLEAGANVYVCGDEKFMAKDVNAALLSIIEREGNLTLQEAEAYLANLRSQKRYLRDVY